jgi:sensor c-di-GMP phosphodiesterase-like protein
MVFLVHGNVEVPLKIVGQGEVFGEMALIDNSPRSASCKADSDCTLIIVSKEQLLDRIQLADPVVRLLMQVLLERLRAQNDRIRGKVEKSIVSPKEDPLAAEKKEAIEKIGLEHRIENGLEDDEFVPFYQPIVDLQTGAVLGCEALVRWIGKDGKITSPGVFMDVIENSYLILKVGHVMIEKSLRDLPDMMQRFSGAPNFFVSINVSGRQFTDPHFLSRLEAVRLKAHLPAHLIKLELTERIMTEGPQALATLHECRELGYLLAIDDFGTGFSSLQYLASMPLTDLKIDRSFLMKMQDDEKSLMIIKSLIHMANLLGLKIIAEGIETQAQLTLLHILGVKMGQGFLFTGPLPLNKFLALPDRFA